MTLRRTLGVVALLLAGPVPAQAQVVFGHVIDRLNGRPLATTSVMLLDSMGTAVGYAESDSLGRFHLRAPRPGHYQLYLDQLAYKVFMTDTLALHEADELELLLRMTPLPLELGRVVVSAERRTARLEKLGFYRRQSRSSGYLLGPEQIQERHPHVTTDLLRQIPSVQLRWSAAGYLVTLRRRLAQATSGGCRMKLVLDGVTVEQDVGFTLDAVVPVQEVLAVEVYASPGGVGAPVQYRGTDAFCGVVLIWTK